MGTYNSNYSGGYGLGFGDLNGTNTSWYYENILTEANQYGAIFSTSFFGLGLTAANFATFSGLISSATNNFF